MSEALARKITPEYRSELAAAESAISRLRASAVSCGLDPDDCEREAIRRSGRGGAFIIDVADCLRIDIETGRWAP
jgi:hypothetical protein